MTLDVWLSIAIPLAATAIIWILKKLLDAKIDPISDKISDHDTTINNIVVDSKADRAANVVTAMSVARIEGWIAASNGRSSTLPEGPYPESVVDAADKVDGVSI